MAGRDELYGEWSQAGMMGEVTCGGAWVALLPKDDLPEKGTEAYELIQKDIQVFINMVNLLNGMSMILIFRRELSMTVDKRSFGSAVTSTRRPSPRPWTTVS